VVCQWIENVYNTGLMTLYGTQHRKLVFLDIETTGTSTDDDRITEIGALVYENGRLIKTFSELVNPGREIPLFITKITGITNSMVINKRSFEEISDELHALLHDAIFVAHNVGFDYGFIKSEFKRVGIDYSADHFCTVQLSRHLYPEFQRHNLDEVISRMGLTCESRHRAFDDAQVLLKFYEHAHSIFPQEYLSQTIVKILKKA
jgi:DNA polymerase III subunit epsilon